MCSKVNAAGLVVEGSKNPNWKGGKVERTCHVCNVKYYTKVGYTSSKYCSMSCVGIAQRTPKGKREGKWTTKICEVCSIEYSVYKSKAERYRCCSKDCSFKLRSIISTGENNSNWNDGISRLPYPYNWQKISKAIRRRDGNKCQNPNCKGHPKIDVHHIDYDKMNVADDNLITLCTVCNSKANFNRDKWKEYYSEIVRNLI